MESVCQVLKMMSGELKKAEGAPREGGVCYLVGAGPGDAGLLTLRGKEVLERATVVVYDHLCNPELLEFAAGARRIYAGKQAGRHAMRQEEINELLVRLAREGEVVVRLKGGDPFVFGRGGEEALALAEAGVRFEVVPGVSSAVAAPAYAGVPVTHRGMASAVTIFTGHEEPGKEEGEGLDYAALAKAPGTKVLLMGMERLGAITRELMRHGMGPEMPACLVRWGTLPGQEVLEGTLGTIAELAERAGMKAPVVAVFGEVVGLRRELAWFEKRPLHGARVAVTRARKQASGLLRTLRELGADAYELPTIRIEPPEDVEGFRQLVKDAHTYDWLVFTSPNGVDAFFEAFYEIYGDARCLGGVRVAAIGPATAERVRFFRFSVDVQPPKFVAEEIVEALRRMGSVENQTFLLPRAAGARDVLPKELTRLGAIVDEVAAYRTVPESLGEHPGARRFAEEGADYVTFTSSSTAENFHALGLVWPEGCRAVSIGPVTSATLRELGYEVAVEAERHDIAGLVEALCGLHRGGVKG